MSQPHLGPALEVRLADCLVELSCDQRLGGLHARLADLFGASVADPARAGRRASTGAQDGTPRPTEDPGRRLRVEVRLEPSGEVAVSAPDWRSAGLQDGQAVEAVLAAVNAGVLPGSALLTLHAGVVEGAGGAIAWPASSGAGKSTLVAACLRVGYPLVSDEALCLDPVTRLAVPYPKPVSLHPSALALLGIGAGPHDGSGADATRSAPELGSVARLEPVAVQAVVLIDRSSGTGLRRVGAEEAVAALLRHSFNHWRMPAAAVSTVHAVVSGAATYRLSYDDPSRGAALLADELPPPTSATRLR